MKGGFLYESLEISLMPSTEYHSWEGETIVLQLEVEHDQRCKILHYQSFSLFSLRRKPRSKGNKDYS